MDISGALNILLWAGVVFCIGWCAFYFWSKAGVPQPFAMVGNIIIAVIFVLIFIGMVSGGIHTPIVIK